MRILDRQTWLAVILALMAGLSAPATAEARAKYSVKASDWLFTEADKPRVDDLARQAASRWYKIGDDPATIRKFKEAHDRLSSYFGDMENVEGRVEVWKAGELMSLKEGRKNHSLSFVRQTEFRVLPSPLGTMHFYETRNLQCLQAHPDKTCPALEFEIWHYAKVSTGLFPAAQLNFSRVCALSGQDGVVNRHGLTSVKCKGKSGRRPSALLSNQTSAVMHDYLKLSGKAVTNGVVEVSVLPDALTAYYGLGSWDGTRSELEVVLGQASTGSVPGSYVMLLAIPGSQLGGAPSFNLVQGDTVVKLGVPFVATMSGLKFLCDEEWGTCFEDHVLGWSSESSGRTRLDIDGCSNGICFKGVVQGTYVPPKFDFPSVETAAETQ